MSTAGPLAILYWSECWTTKDKDKTSHTAAEMNFVKQMANALRWAINNMNTYYKNYENKILEQCFLHKKSSSGVGYKNFFKGKPPYTGNVNIMYICRIPFCILFSSNYIIIQLQRSQMYIIAPVQLGYTVTVKLTKKS